MSADADIAMADALEGWANAEARIETLEGQLAECYRLTGADPDGDTDAALAPFAVAEVRRLREESDAESDATDKRIETLEQERDALSMGLDVRQQAQMRLRARAERAEAERLGIPVFEVIDELRLWLVADRDLMPDSLSRAGTIAS